MALVAAHASSASNASSASTGPGALADDHARIERLIESQPICIGSTVASAGELADAVYYRTKSLPDGRVAVGYYAFFSEERPWGNNWLTWSVLPALAIDAFYTRALLVAPGYQRLAYGKGDVEGVRVVFHDRGTSLDVDYAVADDGTHTERVIPRERALGLDERAPGTLHFYTDVWSHQLGGTAARRASDLVYSRCYAKGSVLPLPDAVATEFRLAHRAKPASLNAALATVAVSDLEDAQRAERSVAMAGVLAP